MNNIYADQNAQDLLETHKRLRVELSAIAHWRRLLRARMDLSTAHVVPPPALATSLTEFVTTNKLAISPEVHTVHSATLGGIEGLTATSLPHLKAHETALREYESSVRGQYMQVSEELAQRHAR